MRNINILTARIWANSFHTSRILCVDSKSPSNLSAAPAQVPEASAQQQASSSRAAGTPKMTMTPTFLDKYFLVWSGHFKSQNDIPNALEKEVIDKARNRARIRINLFGILLTALASYYMVRAGKNAAKRGDSVEQRNRDWHKSVQAEAESSKQQ